jgi:hypothetical protein
MRGKYIFLILFVSIDIAILSACLVTYMRRRKSGRPLPSAIWASYPLLIALLVLVPLVIVFEDVFVAVIFTALAVALFILIDVTRGYHLFAYPRGKRFRENQKTDPFRVDDEEDGLPY